MIRGQYVKKCDEVIIKNPRITNSRDFVCSTWNRIQLIKVLTKFSVPNWRLGAVISNLLGVLNPRINGNVCVKYALCLIFTNLLKKQSLGIPVHCNHCTSFLKVPIQFLMMYTHLFLFISSNFVIFFLQTETMCSKMISDFGKWHLAS